jgi:hypothetical protein
MYILFDMAIGTLILIITAISIRIQGWTNDRKIPSWIQLLTVLSWKLQCRPVANSIENESHVDVTSYDEVEMKDKEEKEVKPANQNSGANVLWTDVTSAIDFYMFFIFLFIILIATAICFGLASSA